METTCKCCFILLDNRLSLGYLLGMNTAKKLICLAGMSLAVLVAPSVYADDYAATGNPADLNVTDAIKMKLDGDTSLSRSARSLQVITTDSTVLLRGTVASQAEADRVQRYAQTYAGDHQVKSEITIAAQ
jgi:osmotically-inducible protein OsmY